MNVKERYDEAKKVYAEIGVDTDKALEDSAERGDLHALLAGRRCDRL